MSRALKAGLLFIALLAAEQTDASTAESRQHFALRDETTGVSYEITRIVQTPNETENREIFLVEDRALGDRLVITDRRDYLNQTREIEVVDP